MSQTEHQLSLSPFYAGWDLYQQKLVKAIAPLTVEQLATRPSPHYWSVGMIMTHVVANRTWWFHKKMGEGLADIADYTLWDNAVCEENFNPNHSALTLVTGLERTWQMIHNTLARLTPADLQESITIRNWLGEERPPQTRQQIIWGTLEHDIYHGGEISYMLGANGLPSLTLD